MCIFFYLPAVERRRISCCCAFAVIKEDVSTFLRLVLARKVSSVLS